ncbi:flagellar protein FlgN [Serpentinicella sp. ANB-PHB4]|uniref:flagellar protein FlgN n=1 Tax=Serpentinicella sp. ANB-PHB4 TaxID=3074076 RepID=UPI00285B88D4|nr:flagellar protein FlgN [Serpentinicella sp. ANB-PHB4]MDR5659797.1 flagellar protein FlgN [Serpentinicella sp. ANB-PHB4]
MKEIIDYLMQLSEAKMKLMQGLEQLTKNQEKAIVDRDEEKLTQLISDKQKLMKKVDILDKEFVEKYEQVKTQGIKEEHSEAFKALQNRIKEIMDLIEKISTLDKNNIKETKKSLNDSKQQLKSVRSGVKAYKGYSKKAMDGASIFLDKKN